MKQINDYITEKFKINSKTVDHIQDNLSDEDKDRIIDKLCIYFQGGGFYNGKQFNTRLSIVEEYFDNDIYAFFDKLDLWEDMAEYMDISKIDFMTYVKANRKELYDEINDFVLR